MTDSRGDIPTGSIATPKTATTSPEGDSTSDVARPSPSQTPSMTTTMLLTVWRHIEDDESISTFDHARQRPPKFCGLFKFSPKIRLRVGHALLIFAEIEIGLELLLASLFLWEYFSANHRRGDAAWGLTFCPSRNSSLIQATLSFLIVIFSLIFILGKFKRNLYLIRVSLVTTFLAVIGRLTLGGVWFQCASNVAVLPLAVAQVFALELVRFYHWQAAAEIVPPTVVPSAGLLVKSGEGLMTLRDLELFQNAADGRNKVPSVLTTPQGH